MNWQQQALKRFFDLLLSSAGLLCLWPIILVCMVIARRDTGKSGLFRQKRIGQHGKMINVLKIRTMNFLPGENDSTVTTADDERITATGKKLRQWKLDELPQLWNVLTGDMSFVGPRPDVPGYLDSLQGEDRLLLELRPGITGPATIKYREEEQLLNQVKNPQHYNDTVIFPDKVNINLRYRAQWSFINDIRYILITLKLIPIPANLNLDVSASDTL